MSKISKLTKRVMAWKDKAIERANLLRYYRKELARVKKERDLYKKKLEEERARIKELEAGKCLDHRFGHLGANTRFAPT